MIFRLLLWILAWRINSLAKHNQNFKKVLAGYDVVLQFRTRDQRVQRYFAFCYGHTYSRTGVHPKPTMSFVFNNAKEALELIKFMGDNPDDKTIFIFAIRDKKLAIEGDMAYLTWFQAIAKYFGPEQKTAKTVGVTQ